MRTLRPVLLSLISLVAAGCGSALVGAECASGYEQCEGECVDTTDDHRHCGGCGMSCGQFVCSESACDMESVRPDAGDGDGGDGDGDGGDGDGGIGGDGDTGIGITDGGPQIIGVGVVLSPDAGLGGDSCGAGLRWCAGDCVELSNDVLNCGRCGNECDPDDFCSNGVCDADCAAGLIKCGTKSCKDPNSKFTCGGCSTVCKSGICIDAECADALPGHIVMLGHDFVDSNPFMRTLLGNAIFLGQGSPVRTLVYQGEALPQSLAGVRSAIGAAEAAIGRTVVLTVVNASDVTEMLDRTDVFLIHAQAGATDSELDLLGVNWGQAMVDFVRRGGVIVGLDGPSDDNMGTFQVLEPAELFLASERETVDGGNITVVAPGRGLALRVGVNYAAEENTVQFLDVMSGGEAVSHAPGGELVIIDRTVIP